MRVIVSASSSKRRWTLAPVGRVLAGGPASPSGFARAIVKQAAWAAAMICSGFEASSASIARKTIAYARRSAAARDLASALGVDFDGHETVTVTVDDLPGAVLSTVDRRCSQRHFLQLAVDVAGEPLEVDRETEGLPEPGDEGLRIPGLVVERLGRSSQELGHLLETHVVTAHSAQE